ncbi:MAG: hypothetical protein GX300_02350 [Tissierellia bacterium]|nr:hypothetical protein [Tissierellia bacterium]
MKNNIRALLLHFIIVIISFILLAIFVATGPKLGKYTTNIVTRVLVGVMLLLAYVFSGTLLYRNTGKKFDFFVGSSIGIIGLALWIYTFSKAGVKLFETIPEELSGCWVLMNIYYTPFTFLDFLFGLPNIPIISLLRNIVPTILMGLGLKYKRLKYKYR